jgi:uncharacterized protein YjbJ (UPF0337 family)
VSVSAAGRIQERFGELKTVLNKKPGGAKQVEGSAQKKAGDLKERFKMRSKNKLHER